MLVFEAQWGRYDDANSDLAPAIGHNPDIPLFFESEERVRRWLEWKAAWIWTETFLSDPVPKFEWTDTDKGLWIDFSDPYNPNNIYYFEAVMHASEDEGW